MRKTLGELGKGHTPTPWASNVESKRYPHVTDKEGNYVAGFADSYRSFDEDAANAAFIALACNSHDALVSALKISRPYVAAEVKKDGGIDDCDMSLRLELEAIDAALSLAAGKEEV